MKNKFKSLILFLLVATILGIAASNIIRIRDIQGDKTGDPTLRQRLNTLDNTKADTTFLESLVEDVQVALNRKVESSAIQELNIDSIAVANRLNSLADQSRVAGGTLIAQNAYYNTFTPTNQTPGDGSMRIGTVIFEKDTTVASIGFYVKIAGDYTADNFNGVGLYSTDGTTMTLIAQSANDASIFLSTGYKNVAFTSPIHVTAGRHIYAILRNESANVTSPSIYGCTGDISDPYIIGHPLCGFLTAQATLPATVAEASFTSSSAVYYVNFYTTAP